MWLKNDGHLAIKSVSTFFTEEKVQPYWITDYKSIIYKTICNICLTRACCKTASRPEYVVKVHPWIPEYVVKVYPWIMMKKSFECVLRIYSESVKLFCLS